MSVSYWVARKLGALIALFYVAVMGVLVVSYYHSGPADPEQVARFYPPGVYAGTDKYHTVREIYGLDSDALEKRFAAKDVEIISYTGDGAVVIRDDKRETAPIGDVVKFLGNKNSSKIEEALSPLHGPLNTLLEIHLRFLHRVENAVGGDENGYRRLVIPKIAIACAYLGVVLIAFLILRSVDRAPGKYQGGYSLVYASFTLWPIAVIVVSFAGISVIDVIRHLPESYFFLRWYVVGGWIAMFAWPLFTALLSILDIIHAFLRVGFSQACTHIGVLAAGVVSIPLVTVGVLFALLVAAIYVGYRAAKRMILPRRN